MIKTEILCYFAVFLLLPFFAHCMKKGLPNKPHESNLFEEIKSSQLGKREVIKLLEHVSRLTCSQRCKFSTRCVNTAFQSYPGQSSTTGECFLLSFPTGRGIEFDLEKLIIDGGDMKLYSVIPAFEFKNCAGAYSAGNRKNAMYYLKGVGWQYCDMDALGECGTGGWTLAMLADGSNGEFLYDSDLWTTEDVLNEYAGKRNPLTQVAKYTVFNKMAFSYICLGMKVQGVTRYAKIYQSAPSLLALFGGEYKQTNLTLDQWKGLLPDPQIQSKCVSRQGINLDAMATKIRIGITTNDENCDVEWTDSWIGVGRSTALWCNMAAKEFSAGNELCSPMEKHTLTPALVYLFIQ